MMIEEPEVPEATIREQLKPFFDTNPEAELQLRQTRFYIRKPWGDSTVVLRIPPERDALVATLNKVYLPPRFTALRHTDTKDVEFIFTAFPIAPELHSRKFSFLFESRKYECEFAESSSRLIAIAEASSPIEAPTETEHRHLSSYAMYLHYQREHGGSEEAKNWKPMSFWLRAIDLTDDELVDLARHLNFFMRYSDPKSPIIEIHEPAVTKASEFVVPWKPVTNFPTALAGRRLNQFIHRLWESSRTRDPFRRFLHLYQVIEYCSFYFVQDNVLASIRRTLMTPDLPTRVEEITREILEAITEEKLEEVRKTQMVFQRYVDPKKVWEAVEPNAKLFARETVFEGGLRVQALIRDGWQVDDFVAAWDPKVADSVRTIRNGIVHAREKRMTAIIAPTRQNENHLQPWLPVLEVAAKELIVFSRC